MHTYTLVACVSSSRGLLQPGEPWLLLSHLSTYNIIPTLLFSTRSLGTSASPPIKHPPPPTPPQQQKKNTHDAIDSPQINHYRNQLSGSPLLFYLYLFHRLPTYCTSRELDLPIRRLRLLFPFLFLLDMISLLSNSLFSISRGSLLNSD